MGGFKESLNDLEIYRLQSNSGQSIQNSNILKIESRPSPFERRYLAKRQQEKESTRASNLIEEKISTNNPSAQKLPASESSLEQLASHFNHNFKKNRK